MTTAEIAFAVSGVVVRVEVPIGAVTDDIDDDEVFLLAGLYLPPVLQEAFQLRATVDDKVIDVDFGIDACNQLAIDEWHAKYGDTHQLDGSPLT